MVAVTFFLICLFLFSQGNRIHASVKRTLVYKFINDLREGSVYHLQFLGVSANVGEYRTCRHSYKLNFQFTSKVNPMESGHVLGDGFDFVPISYLTLAAAVNTVILVGELFVLYFHYVQLCRFAANSITFTTFCTYGVNTDSLNGVALNVVDVVGMLTGVGTEKQYERNGSKTKLNVISLEADG